MVNPAFDKVLGWDREFLLKANFFDLLHYDDRERIQARMIRFELGEESINPECLFDAKMEITYISDG